MNRYLGVIVAAALAVTAVPAWAQTDPEGAALR